VCNDHRRARETGRNKRQRVLCCRNDTTKNNSELKYFWWHFSSSNGTLYVLCCRKSSVNSTVVAGFSLTSSHWIAAVDVTAAANFHDIQLLASAWTENRSYICQYHCKYVYFSSGIKTKLLRNIQKILCWFTAALNALQLAVFTQRNFVADVLQVKSILDGKRLFCVFDPY